MDWSKTRNRIAFPLFIIGLIAVAVAFREPLESLLASGTALEDVVEATGVPAAPALVALQVLQVIVFIIPGEVVQIAAGYLFGVIPGAALSVLGILLGSMFNYWIGRALGRPFVESVTPTGTLARIEATTGRRGTQIGFFLLFVIPGIPKDILCYVAGAAGMRFWPFIAFSTVGRLPGIVGSAVIGATAAQQGLIPAVVLLAAAAVLLVVGVSRQRQLERLLSRMIARCRTLCRMRNYCQKSDRSNSDRSGRSGS